MNPYKLKISQLRALVAIAQQGNFSAAALDLDISQSTVSHAIASLEEELGVVLLNRGRHGAQLTPVGERITARAQQVLDLLGMIVADADAAKGLQGGTLRIATFRSVATRLLPGVIARLHQRYPQLNLTILEVDEVDELRLALLQGQVDISLAEILPGDEFESIKLLDDEYIALLPAVPHPRDAQLTCADLATAPLIASRHQSCFSRLEAQLRQCGEALQVSYRIRHDSSMVGMVEQGLGIAILPRLAAEPIPPGVQMCRLPFPLSRPIGASMLKDALHTPALYVFLDALQGNGEFSSESVAG